MNRLKFNEQISDSLRTQRSFLLFENGIRAEQTARTYKIYLERFRKFAKIKDYDSLITMSDKDRRILLEDYILANKRKYRYTTLDTMLGAIIKFFTMNDIVINAKKLHSLFPARTKTIGYKAYTTEDVKLILDQTRIIKHKALIHFLASSGVRAGAISDLRLKHLKDMPQNCKSVLVYADSLDEYTAFISPEASEFLDLYLEQRKNKGEKLNPDSFVFVTDSNEQFKYSWTSALMCRMSRKLITRNKVTNTTYDKKGAHALRKRFNTIVKMRDDCNISLGERLLGHSQTIKLDNAYFDPSNEQLFSEYLKVLPYLMVDEKYKLRQELQEKQDEVNELQSSRERIRIVESQLSEIREHLKNIKP